MNNITAGLIGAAVGLGGGYFLGLTRAKKEVRDLKDQLNEIELYYSEQMDLLEGKIKEISDKMKKKETVTIDGEEIELLDPEEWDELEEVDDEPDYDEVVGLVTGKKPVTITQSKIHVIDDTEAMELVNTHKAKLVDAWVFSCGTLTKEDKESPILDSSRLVGIDILERIKKVDSEAINPDGDTTFFPYFVYNENEQIVFEISKEDRTYLEYMNTVS